MLLRCRQQRHASARSPSYPEEHGDEKEEAPRRCEHISERQPPAHETRLRRRRTDLPPNQQRHVWPDEVVVTAKQLEVAGKALAKASVGRTAPLQVGCDPLPES